MRLRSLSMALALIACGVAGDARAQPFECMPLAGWREVADAGLGKFTVFGEMHGTAESPSAIREFVCALAKEGGATLVAVEFDSSQDAVFQAAWASASDLVSTLKAALPNVLGGRVDGVASVAMLEMLSSLHALKLAGADIHIVAFNGARDAEQSRRVIGLPGQEPHEAAQAENIRVAAAARDYRHVVVLVGNVHASKGPSGAGDKPTESMAMKLAPREAVLSLLVTGSGGTAWNCRLKPDAKLVAGFVTADDLDCSAHAWLRHGGIDGDPRMALDPDHAAGFDGYVFLGPVTASPPAG